MTPNASASKEVAVVDEPVGALALADDEWGDVESGYVGEAPPTAKPVVPRFTFNAKPGQGFIDELDDSKIGFGETLRCVLLLWSEKRAYWKDPFGTNAEKSPTCRSTNMIAPDDSSLDKQAEHCHVCPHSDWQDNVPPACGVRVDVMLYLPDSQRVVRTSFGGLSLKHLTRYLGGFMTRLPQRPPMAFITEITVDSQETPNGEFLVPKFKIAGEITRVEAAPLIALRDELRKQWEALAAEDLDGAHEGDDKAGPDPFAEQNGKTVVDAFDGAEIIDVDEEPF